MRESTQVGFLFQSGKFNYTTLTFESNLKIKNDVGMYTQV